MTCCLRFSSVAGSWRKSLAGEGKGRHGTNDAGERDRLKQRAGFISGRGKPYMFTTLPERRGRGCSAKLASAVVMWWLSTGPRHPSRLSCCCQVLW